MDKRDELLELAAELTGMEENDAAAYALSAANALAKEDACEGDRNE